MSYGNNGYQGGGYNRPQKMYCGGLKKEYKQGQRGQWESIRLWFSLKQMLEHAFGEQGYQAVQNAMRQLPVVNQNVVKFADNGDIYVKCQASQRREPSPSGDTHSLSINTYVAPQNNGGQGGYQQQQERQGGLQNYGQVQQAQPAPQPPTYNVTQPHPAHQGPQPFQNNQQPAPPPPPPPQENIPGLPPEQAPQVTGGGYPETWND